MRRPASARGQALVPLVVLLAPLAAVATATLGVSRLVTDQTRLQVAVDAAAYSAAALQSETLNEVAVGNRLLVAHLATTAQATSLVSHYRALERAARVAQAAGVAIPGVNTVLAGVGQTAGAAAAATELIARAVVPLARGADAVRRASVRAAVLRADARLAARVRRVREEVAPDSRLAPQTEAVLRGAPLGRRIASVQTADVGRVASRSIDRFTAGGRGRPPLGRTFGLAGVGKSGTTRLGGADLLLARDRVGLDLGRHGRVGIEATARGGEFGQGPLEAGWRLAPGGSPVTRVEAVIESFAGIRLTARAAARAVYRRPGHPNEPASLFGPFWRPRLVPFGAN